MLKLDITCAHDYVSSGTPLQGTSQDGVQFKVLRVGCHPLVHGEH